MANLQTGFVVNFLDRSFCGVPHNELMISPNGDYRVCSLINSHEHDQGLCRDANGVPMNVLTHSFEEAVNSQCHKSIRTEHANNTFPATCSCCFDRDAIPGGNSMRKYKTVEILRTVPDWVEGPTHKTSGPIGLDLRFGVLCNLKCVVCGPWYSDKWNDDYAAYHRKDTIRFAGKTISIAPDAPKVGADANGVGWWESDVWWDRFDKIKPTLRHLYFTGGEPMIVPAHDRVLAELVEGGFAKDVVIEIDTNLTALNPRIIEQWRHFKYVDVRISLDAVNEQYDLVRFPGKFSRVENNVRALLANKPDNIRAIVTSCVTPLTVFYMHKMDEWVDGMGFSDPKPIHRRFVEEPFSLSLKFSSKERKDKVLQWLAANPSPYSPTVEAYVRNNYNEFHPGSNDLVKYMDFLDSRRGTNWRSTMGLAAEVLGV